MKTQVEILQGRIATVCEQTVPQSRARTKALATIKWRLESHEGLCAGIDDKLGCALVLPQYAQVFDGRDNEHQKKRFYENALGIDLDIVILDQTAN